MRLRKITTTVVATGAAFALAGCSGSAGTADGSGNPITIGWSLQLTGPVGSGNEYMQAAVEKAVSDINGAGGVDVGGTKRQLKLKVVDNRSDIPTVADQVRSLIVHDDVDAVLGPVITEFGVAGAAVAEQYGVPYFMTAAPEEAFVASNPDGWKYTWDSFYSEQNEAKTSSAALASIDTNKKVALLTDNTADGQTFRTAYSAALEAAGFEIVTDLQYPLNNTDFSAQVQKAKAADAQVLVAVSFPTDASNLIKEMKAQAYVPDVALFPKSSSGPLWPGVAGATGVGSVGTTGWSPTAHGDGGDQLASYLEAKGSSYINSTVGADFYSMVQTYVAAVEKAGTTDKDKVNAALADLRVDTVTGPLQFNSNHFNDVPTWTFQWQGTSAEDMKPVQVYPDKSGDWLTPPPGLAK